MAYVLWRVVLKKYSRVRLGLTGSGVTPTSTRAVTYDEESWKPSPEDSFKDIERSTEVRHSKSKRVKSILKKCKNVLGNKSASLEVSTGSDPSSSSSGNERSSFCLDDKIEDNLNVCQINELDDIFEDAHVSLNVAECTGVFQVANIVEVRGPPGSDTTTSSSESANDQKEGAEEKTPHSEPETASPVLSEVQDKEEGGIDGDSDLGFRDVHAVISTPQVKSDVESLVDKYFGSLYKNYEHSRKCLIRQARDLLVCEYHGSLQRFEDEFCTQANKLLQHLKNEQSSDSTAPSGWPLCLGQSGVVIHLGPLNVSVLRNRDCYLCVRNRSSPGLEVTLTWRQHHQIYCRSVAEFRDPLHSLDDIMCSSIRSASNLETISYEDYDGTDLPEMLHSLLVSVEHAIKRVPLDDLTFPCPQCLQYLPLDRQEDDVVSCVCQCSCRLPGSPVAKKDSSIQTSPMFEFVGSIPHIDSDEDDDKESVKSGSSNKKLEIARPKRIYELPDKLLMSGINLPGTTDTDGRPIILCYAECISRAGLNKYEIAKLLLYYFSIPTLESREKGFTVLLLAENEADYRVLEVLDKSICLIVNSAKIHRFLIWTPGLKEHKEVKPLSSRAQVTLISEESYLRRYISRDQTPASCGGTCTHDQLEWVEFFKQLEPFLAACKIAGRSLLTTLSQLRNEEVPHQITRRFLNHQCRQISKALDSENVQKLRREGRKTLTSLAERRQWLANSKDVKRNASLAYDSFEAVERVTKRLEQLKLERMERLKELARYRTLQEEADGHNTNLDSDLAF
nr:uncharacterized protein LOC111507754 [Leptinotarsa decemlineata]